tara:strand:- start:658 stop:765 length:108 start_codon:yes stop_codon:yes gene_type:complete
MQQIYCLEEELLEALEDKITGAGYFIPESARDRQS